MKRISVGVCMLSVIGALCIQDVLAAPPPPPGGRPPPRPHHAPPPRPPRHPRPAPGPRGPDPALGFIGAIIGGAINHALSTPSGSSSATTPRRQTSTSRKTYTKKRQTSSLSQAQRAANREVQTALNYFGCPAGTPDGVIGSNSRKAIACYQRILDYPATGQLTKFERGFLVDSYERAIAGGELTRKQIAADPSGVRGLLLSYRDERAKAPTEKAPAPEQPSVAAAPTLIPAAAAAAAAVPAAAAMPSFLAVKASDTSVASHCNRVNLQTSANGGFVTLSSMEDPRLALNEQFCIARTYAIAQGEQLAAGVQGFTSEQIAEQCDRLGPALEEHVAALSLKPASAVQSGVLDFALSTGMPSAQLIGTAKICLSVGYRTDDTRVALGSALLLTTLGERGYGELIGHHLAQGLGTARRPDLALAWYEMGFDASDNGTTAALVPTQPERTDLVRKAVYMVNGKSGQSVSVAQEASSAAVPNFALSSEESADSETLRPVVQSSPSF